MCLNENEQTFDADTFCYQTITWIVVLFMFFLVFLFVCFFFLLLCKIALWQANATGK